MEHTKERVASLLAESRGTFLSGAAMADELGVSRNAVWKAIRSLRAEGYAIEAVTNRGYRLESGRDILSEALIAKTAGVEEDLIHIYDELPSTNRKAKKYAVSGAPHGTTVLADRQSDGSGRYRKKFFSPPGGLYMSVILKPPAFPYVNPGDVTGYTAVCVVQAVRERCGCDAMIKPLNDLYLNGKKIGGILTESVSDFDTGEIEWIVTGIGINLRTKEDLFPDELREKAGSVYPDGCADVTRGELAAAILKKLLTEHAGRSGEEIRAAYRRWSDPAFPGRDPFI